MYSLWLHSPEFEDGHMRSGTITSSPVSLLSSAGSQACFAELETRMLHLQPSELILQKTLSKQTESMVSYLVGQE